MIPAAAPVLRERSWARLEVDPDCDLVMTAIPGVVARVLPEDLRRLPDSPQAPVALGRHHSRLPTAHHNGPQTLPNDAGGAYDDLLTLPAVPIPRR